MCQMWLIHVLVKVEIKTDFWIWFFDRWNFSPLIIIILTTWGDSVFWIELLKTPYERQREIVEGLASGT
jgi:hypothetical protein